MPESVSPAGSAGAAESVSPAESVSGRFVRIRAAGLAWRQAGDEVVVLDLAAARYHALNVSGALLWGRLGAWTTIGELAGTLARSCGLTPESATADVECFLAGCSAAGLVEIRAHP